MNTIERVKNLAEDRGLTLWKLALLCEVSHSTIANAERRGGQLSLDTIERICDGPGISLSEFFAVAVKWGLSHVTCIRGQIFPGA